MKRDPPDPDADLVVFEETGAETRSRTPPPAPRKATPKRSRSFGPDHSPMLPHQWFLAQIGLPTLVGSHRTGLPVATWAMAAGLAAFYAAEPALGGAAAFAYHPGDPPWVAVAASVAHANVGHLLGNLWGLLVFGGAVEQASPRTAYVPAFFAVGAVTMLAEGLFLPAGGGVLGISGAVLAAVAACLFLQPQASVTFGVFPIVLRVPMLIYMAVYAAIQVSGLLDRTGNTAWVAHVTGLVLGLVLGRAANTLWPDDPKDAP